MTVCVRWHEGEGEVIQEGDGQGEALSSSCQCVEGGGG